MTVKKWPVAEIFGPTIQGEGVDQGVPCYFIRFGGCDFKCEWCDTPHAVLAQNVRHLPRMSEFAIVDALESLARAPSWVVISGGNPAMHDLSTLTRRLQDKGYRVAVETQGTRYKEWLSTVDRLCVSPKPPSSGMKYTPNDLVEFLDKVFGDAIDILYEGRLFVKVVVFDQADYEFARKCYSLVREDNVPFFVSAGNDAGQTVGNPSRVDERTTEQVRNDLANSARWLANRVMVDPAMAEVKVQSQFHVQLWGNELGR